LITVNFVNMVSFLCPRSAFSLKVPICKIYCEEDPYTYATSQSLHSLALYQKHAAA